MIADPYILFNKWFSEQSEKNPFSIHGTVCLSTIGLDRIPNARYVSLKDVKEGKFIITGYVSSRKGKEIQENNGVALTFWWPHISKQVRIQGFASFLSDLDSDFYFNTRSLEEKIASCITKQGEAIEDPYSLEQLLNRKKEITEETSLKRPINWGGFSITPIRFEFMTFNENRLHIRNLFQKNRANDWVMNYIQP